MMNGPRLAGNHQRGLRGLTMRPFAGPPRPQGS
jgi:hypothetical protein